MLLGPVQRQIQFGQPRRGELDGLPALQDRLDQLGAQKREVDETANVAPGKAVKPGQLLRDRARPVASSSNPARSNSPIARQPSAEGYGEIIPLSDTPGVQ